MLRSALATLRSSLLPTWNSYGCTLSYVLRVLSPCCARSLTALYNLTTRAQVRSFKEFFEPYSPALRRSLVQVYPYGERVALYLTYIGSYSDTLCYVAFMRVCL